MDKYEKVVELARRNGFFWGSFEIYGGVSGFVDYGPLGKALKENIARKWRWWFVKRNQDFVVEIETPVVNPAIVFEASGHVEHFTDYIVTCLKCGRKYRADHLIEDVLKARGEEVPQSLEALGEEGLTRLIVEKGIKCPACGGELSKVEKFNLLFKTYIGPYTENVGYLRPEAAQGMFINFRKVYELLGRRLPLGIAQVGRVMRNEISPRQGLIRLREFTIMEVEVFFDPKNPRLDRFSEVEDVEVRVLTEEDVARGVKEPRVVTVREAVEKGYFVNEIMGYFIATATLFLKDIGIPEDKQLLVAKLPEERAHYAQQTYDHMVYTERWGWIEVAGHAYRTDYDLSRHMKFSGRDLTAQRRLEKPVKIRKVLAKPNPAIIRKVFGSDIGKVMKELSTRSPEDLAKELEEKGFVEVFGKRLGKEAFFIKEVEEVVEVERFVPHVVEPSFGADRLVYAVMEHSLTEKEGRTVLALPRDIAPIQVAVFPIVKRDAALVKIAREIYDMLRDEFSVMYDEEGTIGKRYAKADEIGVPFAITVDGETLKDGTVTIRDRDTWKQVRVPYKKLPQILNVLIRNKEISIEDVEKMVKEGRI